MQVLDNARKLVRREMAGLAGFLNKISGGRISPDTITWIGVAAHLPIAFLIAYGQLQVAGLLLIFFGLFDVLDGELARYKKTASPRGMMLDASTDRVKEVLIYSGIAYYISQTAHFSWSFVPLVACGATITVSYIKAKGEVAHAINHKPDDHHKLNRLYDEGLVPFEVRIAVIILGLLVGQPLIASATVAILATFSVFERIAFIGKRS
ncbi:MAG TPA: CDP-alcohol phosphatidyltransferase family protein [Candidatus Saccharimonadales bacterium]|nr:CDP-alcohol phosphatidyltransferase family protein [Candidatus Saccharimonadales bacterium]